MVSTDTIFILLIQPEFWSGVGCFANNISMFGKFLVHAWNWCGGLNKEHSKSIHQGPNSI
jgi:hypothetical protein